MRAWEWIKKRWRARAWPIRRDILDRDDESLYLRRWYLIGGRRNPLFSLMLHRIYLPDETCHHDHPWNFLTLILKGGYQEEVTQEDGTVISRWNGPGTLLYRSAEHTHRIAYLPSGEAWTLVLRFRRRRAWGFHTPDGGWVPWRTFKQLSSQFVNWCGDWLEEAKR